MKDVPLTGENIVVGVWSRCFSTRAWPLLAHLCSESDTAYFEEEMQQLIAQIGLGLRGQFQNSRRASPPFFIF